MSDFAKRWVSPLWRTLPIEPGHRYGPEIWVTNPGATKANVTVTWFRYDGSTVSSSQLTIQPKHTSVPNFLPEGGDDNVGWAHVVSDEPVAPWGSTPTQVGDPEARRVNMTFFRDDVQETRPIHPLPH